MNCDQIKKKMNECLKNDSDNRVCKEIVDSWKLECEKSSWFGNIFSKSDKTESKESEESPKNVLKEAVFTGIPSHVSTGNARRQRSESVRGSALRKVLRADCF